MMEFLKLSYRWLFRRYSSYVIRDVMDLNFHVRNTFIFPHLKSCPGCSLSVSGAFQSHFVECDDSNACSNWNVNRNLFRTRFYFYFLSALGH